MMAKCASHRSRTRVSWRHRTDATDFTTVMSSSSSLPLVASEGALASAAARTIAFSHLSKRGFLIVPIDDALVKAMRDADRTMRIFYARPNAEKNVYRTRQEGEKVLSHPGYLTPTPGFAELFEVRRSQRDASYHFPPGCELPCMRLFDLLRDLSMRWLGLLSLFLCGDENELTKLAAKDTGPATLRLIHYDQVVELGQHVAALKKGSTERKEAERRFMAGKPPADAPHCMRCLFSARWPPSPCFLSHRMLRRLPRTRRLVALDACAAGERERPVGA